MDEVREVYQDTLKFQNDLVRSFRMTSTHRERKLTDKEFQRRCGTVITYELNKPMTWREFKALPLDVQKSYIDTIDNKYLPTVSAYADMFGISYKSAYSYFHDNHIQVRRSARGKRSRMSKAEASEFEAFYKPSRAEPEISDTTESSAIDAARVEVPSVDTTDTLDNNLRVQNLELSFTFRKFDPQAILNILSAVAVDGEVFVELKCYSKGKGDVHANEN